ncbi:unnamed protein product [Paramecium sonneborni]|uniref:Transmembrane protein n=1 Tax=Paramecium sonneborni TaxID=65129 RepID=A0A8S1KF94_9CILI|nr:unnamed protein product [Paramecium sonneborni]
MMSKFLEQFIANPKVRIDTLLPNYLIYSKMNPDDAEVTNEFNHILAIIKEKFQLSIKLYILSVKRDMVPKKLFITQQVEENLQNTELNSILKSQLLLDLQVFLYALTQIQDIYTMFFKQDFFTYIEMQDILDDNINLNWFNSIIEKRIVAFLINMLGTAKGLLYQLIIEQLNYKDLILLLNKVVVQIFNDCSNSLKTITNDFINITNKCNLCNKYLLMGLFQELSVRAYDLVENYQDFTIFHLSSQDAKEEFARLVINSFDLMNLYINRHDEDIFTPFQNTVLKYVKENNDELEAIEQAITKITNKNKKVITHKIVSKRNQRFGILLDIEGEDESKQRFIIHKPLDKIVITNAKLVQNRWMFVEALEGLTPEQLLKKKEESKNEYSSIQQAFDSLNFQQSVNKIHEDFDISEERMQFITFNESTAEIQSAFSETIKINGLQGETFNTHFSSAAGDIGASLGNCLANINKYHSRKEFLVDFGQTAVVSGSLTYIATQMPVIGQLFALGAFGYFTAKIYSNESSSQKSKNTQLNKLLISTTANVGSGLSGALIGQALIPVPIFGALIGGFIGGLLGGASSSMILEYMSEQRFQNLFELIQFKQENGHWEYSDEYLNQLGLSKQIFLEQLPNNLRYDENKENTWITIISYTYCTVYQAQLDYQKNKKQQLENESNKNNSFQDNSSYSSSTNLESNKQNEQDQVEFPEFIEQASKWIIQNKCLMGLSLPNTEIIIKCIFQNL